MPKIKTVKGIKERFKVTGRGKLVGYKAGKRHLMGSKRAKIKRKMRQQVTLSERDARRIRPLMPYA